MNDTATTAPKTCALAVWSLVLGILGLLCCGFFGGVPAVICGHMALSQIRRAGSNLGGDGLAIGGLVTGYLGIVITTLAMLGILAGMLLPAVASARERARRTHDMSNLKQIGLAAHMYAMDNKELFPSSFTNLATYTGNSPRLFVCPATGHEPGDMASVDTWTDYVLVPGRSMGDAPDSVLAFSKPECFPGEGGNVLFVDGHVEWCPLERYEELTASLAE